MRRERRAGGRKGTSIAWLILVFNALLVFVPIAAFLSLDSFERSLLDSLEHALAQQGRFLAAWLAEAPLTEGAARKAVRALNKQHTARIRIVDASGRLLADSSAPEAGEGKAHAPEPAASQETVPQDSWLYRLYSLPVRLARRYFLPPQPSLESADFYGSGSEFALGPEVRRALAGSYGSATRISSGGQVSVTLYTAVPIMSSGSIAASGAVLVSQSTYRILTALYGLRAQVGEIFLFSMLAALALTIAVWLAALRPIRALSRRAQAALTPEAGGESPFPPQRRRDEIGELSHSLSEFNLRLRDRLAWAERFSQDAAHELKNPIASIRAAAELLESSDDPDGRRTAFAIGEEASRMERIVDGLRRLSRMDSDRGQAQSLDAVSLAANAAQRHARLSGRDIRMEAAPGAGEARVFIDPDRLVIALDTLLDNALSFAPSCTEVRMEAATEGGFLLLSVIDKGPGIPPENMDKIFKRFFSYRPGETQPGRHAGLGLSIAQAVAEGSGGSLTARNAAAGEGAIFTLRLPLRA